MDETRIPLRRASAFAKASSSAKATEDKTEDKLIRANGFVGCSFHWLNCSKSEGEIIPDDILVGVR